MIRRRSIWASAIVIVAVTAAGWPVVRPPLVETESPRVVQDVSRLNPVIVAETVAPTSVQEVVDAVRRHPGLISIGGARHSMGGHIAADGSLHIDTRRLRGVLDVNTERMTVTALAGTTWREIQERIDPADLSVKIMQSYADFTVGGSLSVNAHGRYVGLGPIVGAVDSFKIVLADGALLETSRARHPEVFYGAIGGYGGLGVIVEATIALTRNVRLRRTDETMPVPDYAGFFASSVRHSNGVVLHNADLYPHDYHTVHAVTYNVTGDEATIPDRLIARNASYPMHRFGYWVMSEWPFGAAIRRHAIDPILFAGPSVSWRNYEASYDTHELEPASRRSSTYALQEYFVPVARFDAFVPRLRDILRRHDVNVVNVSIRHATADPGSLLAWANSEVFAFVIYYKQATTDQAQDAVGMWSRELIDAALDVQGSYYLPYQLHATRQQFYRAYPKAAGYFRLKRQVDPTNKFRNRFLDKYSPASP